MKITKVAKSWKAVVGAAPIALGLCASLNAQSLDSWETVDDILLPSAGPSNFDVGVDRSNTVFTVGATSLPATINWSKSSGASLTWDTDLSTTLGGESAGFSAFTSYPRTGDLYVGGWVSTAGISRWVVCQSANAGTNWATSEVFQYGSGSTSCFDLTMDNLGNAYAIGLGHDAKGNNVWITRRMLAGSANWSTVDAVNTSGSSGGGKGIAFSKRWGVFAVGSLRSRNQEVWTVRRSVNQGATWLSVNVSSGNSRATEVTVDSADNIYVVGFEGSQSQSFWTIRRSADGGQTWVIVDSFGPHANAWGITTVPRTDGYPDDVYACGFVLSGSSHWLVRRSLAGGSWNTSDDVPMQNGAQAVAVAADSLGRVFATGVMWDDANPSMLHWITRRLTNP